MAIDSSDLIVLSHGAERTRGHWGLSVHQLTGTSWRIFANACRPAAEVSASCGNEALGIRMRARPRRRTRDRRECWSVRRRHEGP